MRPEIIRNFQQAAALERQGRLAEAASLCAAVMDSVPEEADPPHLLGLIRKQQGRAAEAETLLRASIEKAPNRPEFHANLGNLLSQLKRHADAEQAYRRALALNGAFRPARLGLARLLSDAGIHAAAADEARKLLAADSRDAQAHAALGVALAGQERYADAEAAYREALRIAPGYGAARHNLGALLSKMERIEESLEELEHAAAAGINGAEIDFNRGSALMKLYRFDEGEQVLADAVRRDPQYADAQKLLAKFRFMRGADNFADELARAARRHPDNAELQLALGQVLHGANRLDAAAAALGDALHACGAHPRLLGMLASVHQESGDFTAALRRAREACKANPDDPLLADYEIDALMSLGRADEALPLIQAGRRRRPQHQWYIAIEATAQRLRGDPRYEYLCDYGAMVRTYDLDAPRGWGSMAQFHDDLVPLLHERHQFYAHPLDQSLRRGTQTPRNLIGDPHPVIRAFIAAMQTPIAEYRNAIGVDDAHPLRSRNRGEARLSGCWSVRLTRGGFHVNHIHPEGWISSAYYAEVPDEVADRQRQSGWIKFGEPRYPVPGAGAEKTLQPQAGRLVLFPSYLWHGTTPIENDAPRMTVAFDVVPATGT
ncbi:MAG TPA: tetratricopeptide repeat protein [Woeseiaceae bacterium]|nr:tetratricopeptide repeat protein [Woeseiaceae bacterium]